MPRKSNFYFLTTDVHGVFANHVSMVYRINYNINDTCIYYIMVRKFECR